MPTTYEPIATQTLGSGNSSVTFSSITGTYTDLILVGVARSEYAGLSQVGCGVYFNGSTATNYSMTNLYGTGSSAASLRTTNGTNIDPLYIPAATAAAGTFAVVTYHIMNYANTTTNKTLIARGSDAGNRVVAGVGLWRSTAAITEVTFTSNAGNLTSGSTFTLYGIKAA